MIRIQPTSDEFGDAPSLTTLLPYMRCAILSEISLG